MTPNIGGFDRWTLYQLPLQLLKTDPDQPRKHIDPEGLEELVESIKTHGVLQPILFRWGDDNNLYVVAGERRLEAARRAGLIQIPALYVEGGHEEKALVENLMREDLTAVEEAEALMRLKTAHNYTDEELSAVIGKARNTVSETLLINRLPAAIRDECRSDRQVPKRVLIDIARRRQERSMMTAYRAYREKLAKAQTGKKAASPATPAGRFVAAMDQARARLTGTDTSAWSEEELQEARGAVEALREAAEVFLNPADRSLA